MREISITPFVDGTPNDHEVMPNGTVEIFNPFTAEVVHIMPAFLGHLIDA